MNEYTAEDFKEMKKLKKDFEEVDQVITIGATQRRSRCGGKWATALYNDLNSDRTETT